MPNSKKPIELSIYKGKTRYVKSTIKDRLEREEQMRIGKTVFKPTQRIKNDPAAYTKWKELVKIYKGFRFVTDVDTGCIEKYCLAYSEYIQLQDTKYDMMNKNLDNIQMFHAMDKINLHSQINKKIDIIIKLEDRLFLNPASRIKNIPDKKEDKKIKDPIDKLDISGI